MSMYERLWLKLFELFGKNDFYMDVVGSNLLTLLVFWSTSGLFAFVDATGRPSWMAQYKSQPGKNQPVDKSKLLNAIRVALMNQVLNIPISIGFFYMKRHLGASCRPEDLPSLFIIIRDLAAFVVVEEIGFYYTHRLLHTGPLYRAIHKQHHEWTAPIGVVALYAHPVEHILSNMLPMLSGSLLMKSHLFTVWTWFTVGLLSTVVRHSGYHLPFCSSNEFHDFHHLKFTSNYGTAGWLDYLHGTDKQYKNTLQHKRDHILLGLKPAAHAATQ